MYSQIASKFSIQILLLLVIIMFVTCQKPPDTQQPLACAPHAHPTADSTACDCDSLFHWNDDETQCILDTTSHDFFWEVDSFGTYGSYLSDVSIINRNDIWAAGFLEIDEPDTILGNSTTWYNAVHWDGDQWNILKIAPLGFAEQLQAVFALYDYDVWFARSSSPIHFDGDSARVYRSPDGYPGHWMINDIWGSSTSDVYFVGDKGMICHYDGAGFQQIESNTPLRLLSVFGTPDGEYVFITGYVDSGDLSGNSIALEIQNGICRTLYTGYYFEGDPDTLNYGRFESVTIENDTAYFATGGTWLVKYNFVEQTTTYEQKYRVTGLDYRIVSLSSDDLNDMLAVDAWGRMFHYNGYEWKYFDEVFNQFGPGRLWPRAGQIKDDVIVISCWLSPWSFAPLLFGRRL